MLWVWTDELMQRLEVDERQGWVPLIGYRISPDEDLDRLASQIGMKLTADHEMPANNRILVWKRS